ILAELVDFGVHSAFQLAGDIPATGGEIKGYHEILPKLAALLDHEGQNHADIRARTVDFLDEARLMFLPMDFPYTGGNGPWSIEQQDVRNGTYTEPMAGFITPNNRFRAFTPGLL